MFKNITLVGIVALTYYVAAHLIPVDVFNQSPMIISAIVATLIAGSLCVLVYGLTKPKDAQHHPLESLIIIGSIILWIIILSWCFISFENKVNTRLQGDREMTVGTVISCDRNMSKRRSNETYTSVLSYKTSSGRSFTTEHIENICYKNGSTFQVAYSKSNPSIAKVIDSSEDMDAISGIKTKDITPKALISMVDLSLDDLGVKLNQMSFQWVLDEQNMSWINHEKGLIVGQRDGTVYYTSKGPKSASIYHAFIALGFVEDVPAIKPEITFGEPVQKVLIGSEHKALISRTFNKVKSDGPAPFTLDIKTTVVVMKK